MSPHEQFLHRCLVLARRGGRFVGLNPLVGAVLVRDGAVIAEGWHKGWGMPHAEVDLLDDADVQAEDVLYVNLEPCCHTGKTSPCTDFIIQKGVKHLVYGMQDPNPMVAGEGIRRLREAGIEVTGPVLPELCRRVNRGYVSVMERQRPWITLKSAQTTDGRFLHADGSRLCITSQEQDTWSHTWLRASHDAILVGVQTILSDNPALTTRLVPKDFEHINCSISEKRRWNTYRIILDPYLRVPLDAHVVCPPLADRTIVVTAKREDAYATVLRTQGVLLWHVPLVQGLFDFRALWQRCLTLSGDFHGVASILVEGGPTTWTTFRLARCVDEEVTLVGACPT